MKGEVIMNFKTVRTNSRKFIGKHSTLITFVLAALGMGATVYFASKDIPKAKEEVKAISKDKKLNDTQKRKQIIKTVVKHSWRTTVIAISTVLLVTGTAAITTANAATTIASLTSTAQLAEQKLNAYDSAIDGIPDKKIRDDVKQKANDAIKDIEDDELYSSEKKYLWFDEYTGVKFIATYKQVQAAHEITDLKIQLNDMMTIREFYIELCDLGATFLEDEWPDFCNEFGWFKNSAHDEMKLNAYSQFDGEGRLMYYIAYSEPKSGYYN